MKTGFAKKCINPPYGAPISGYYEARFVKGVLDDLYARVIAFDDGENKALVITVDVLQLEQEHFMRIKNAINEKAGINKEAIFINCSHTHTGPLVGKDFASDLCSDKEYDDFFVSMVCEAALEALQGMEDSSFGIAKTEAKNISFVRRYRMKNGYAATNPGVGNPEIDHPLGTPNETVKVVKITRENGNDICIINFGTHTDTVGGEYISNDFVGYACSILENAVPETDCIFLLAPQGDVNHVNVNPTDAERAISEIDFDGVPRGLKHTEYMGRVVAGAVLSVLSITENVKADKITFGEKTLDLPSNQENDRLDEARHIFSLHESGHDDQLPFKEMELTTAVAEAKRIIRLENGPDSFPFTLSAIKVGDLVFAGIGGEAFTEIGNRICKDSPFAETILCCLTNDEGGYVPTSQAYTEGGYEARSSVLKPGGDDIVVNGMLELLNELK